MRILDRYVLKNFLVPFLFCFFGFIAIWLIFDISQNGEAFIEAKASPGRVAFYYLTQLPEVITLCLPVAMLLSLLYSLSHMSRSNEIISILTAGRSVTRILLPLFGVGLLVTAASTALGYKLAPQSEAIKKTLFEQLRGRRVETAINGQLFRNRAEHRTWYIQKMEPGSNELDGVNIQIEDTDGNITRKYYARRAIFDRATKKWNLERGKTVNFDSEGNITGEELWLEGGRVLENWSENPWRIASSNTEAQILSVPELHDYLQFNSDFPPALLAPYRTFYQYRWASPWWCFILVFIAAPLGIVYSRRGVLAGVAWSIFIFFGTMCFDKLFLALGKGARISPVTAAWAPCIFFLFIGLLLLWLRSTNRELPMPRFKGRKP